MDSSNDMYLKSQMTVDVNVCLWNATAPVEAARLHTHHHHAVIRNTVN